MRPNLQTLDEITRKLAEAVPQELKVARAELEEQFRAVLESVFARMDLVTREEFEIQQKVLARTREKLEQIQRQLDQDDQA
ncbi:MAG TPA: accessory factor UbiK family protein [Wenzhouxiangella sp.]|nr:accessory factor UbiK family protein [Wenzhouxiangella sp.]